jgi:autotransporter-associated beta strand protein
MNKFLFIKYNKLTSMKNFTLKTTTTNVGMDIQRNSFSQLKGKRSGFFAFSSHLNIALLGLFIFFLGQKINAQTTVTYKEQTAYFNAGTVYSNGGGIYNQNAQQMGMWANLGGTKEVVAWRQFKTAGNVTGGTTRSLQVGDEFRITVGAHTVSGEMGFALLSSPTTRGNWANRLENAAISVNLTNYGNWYAKYFDGTTVNAATSSGSNNIGGTTSYKNFVFTCILTAPNRMNIKIDDGTTQSYLYDLLLNTSNPITEYAVYLKDDWDGSSKNNIYWNNSASSDLDYVKNTMTMPIGSSNATFTIAGVLPNGLDAASTSTGSTNALTKSGTGILTLSAANTYTGTTTVSAGVLKVTGQSGSNSSTGTGAVSVNAGGTLSGSGRIGGAVTVANSSSAIFYPNTAATLTLGGNLTVSGTNSVVKLDLSATSGGANDKIVLENKTLTITGSPQITINSAGTLDTTTDYVLIDAGASGSISGNFSTTPIFTGTTPANPSNYTIIKVGNKIQLHYAASCPTITVTPSAAPSATGTVGTAYTSVTFSASGGMASYTYALNSGSLPAGLTLNATSEVLQRRQRHTPLQ